MNAKRATGFFTALAVFAGAFTYINMNTADTSAEEYNYPARLNGSYLQMPYEEEAEQTYSEAAPIVQAADLPSSYDLREEDCVTPVRNQGAEGMCHAFAAVGACESNILKQGLETDAESLDLSEAQLGYFLYTQQGDPIDPLYGDYLNTPGKGAAGGNGVLAAAGLAVGMGTQREEFCSYSDWDTGYSEYERYTGQYRLRTLETISRATDASSQAQVKQWLMESGGVAVAFYSNRSLYYDNGTSYSYYAENKSFYEDANHAVLIVGWDDNYSKENFSPSSRPSNDGAWLIKNSYGPDLFDDGYFWLSYEDPSTGSFCRYIMESVEKYDDVYEYDGAGYITAYSFDAVANIFTAEYDCTLTDVSFYMPSGNPDNTSYEVKVYLLNENTDDPTDGECAASATGTILNSGYYTVPLDENAELLKGQQFSLVLKMRSTGRQQTVYLPIEETTALTSTFSLECHAEAGESYIYSGGIWEDASVNSGERGTFGNIPLKAFAVRNEEYTPLMLQAALEKAKGSDSKNSILAKAVSDGESLLADGGSAASCRRAAWTILSVLEKYEGSVQYPEYIYEDFGIITGDSDGDGSVTISDATEVLTVYAMRGSGQIYRLRQAERAAMNAVSDSEIDISDATEILSIYARQGAGIEE